MKWAVRSRIPEFATYFRRALPEVQGKTEIWGPGPGFALPRPAVLLSTPWRRAGYRVLRRAEHTEPEWHPASYPSRHAALPWSRPHGQPERTSGQCRWEYRGAERQHARRERTVLKRNIAGVEEGDYSLLTRKRSPTCFSTC